VVDHERGQPAPDRGHGGEGNLGVAGAGDVDAGQIGGVALVARIDFENDAILVALGIERRHLALSVRIVEHIGDVLHTHAEP
jgi:hypothetical protein